MAFSEIDVGCQGKQSLRPAFERAHLVVFDVLPESTGEYLGREGKRGLATSLAFFIARQQPGEQVNRAAER